VWTVKFSRNDKISKTLTSLSCEPLARNRSFGEMSIELMSFSCALIVASSKRLDERTGRPRFLVTASQDRTLKLWDLSALQLDAEEPYKRNDPEAAEPDCDM
jgi:WD40 repeat protein